MSSTQNLTLKEKYGPLHSLIGTWEGSKGDDIAPADDRGIENNKYKERMTFEVMDCVQNHEQFLYVLRYSTRAWRLGEENPFHEELGYWSYEPATQQVMRTFLVPRGIALIAGGTAKPDAKEIQLSSSHGSSVFGICSNPFLEKEFKISRFEMKLSCLDEQTIRYEQDTVIEMPGRKEPFHHTDKNTLQRIS